MPHGLHRFHQSRVTGSFTGIVTSNSYNARLQPVVISAASPSQTVLSLSYGFGLGTANNGNVLAIQNNRDLDRSQSFTYDELNRVKTAEVPTAWSLSFGYDIWANLLTRTVTKGSAPMLNVAATTKNQILGFCYDAAGNTTRQGACGGADYTYDAENRISNTVGVTYTYDGDGKRVMKSSGKLYWTGVGSDPLAESDLSGNVTDEFVFFGGKRIARRKSTGEVNYYFADHLGTSRVVTNATGTVLDDADFYPFGRERPILSSSGNSYKFTGKERDPETGLDYFGARYYDSHTGRFASVDPGKFLSRDPQSLNRYAYARNNPVKYVDPTGRYFVVSSDLQQSLKQYLSSMLRTSDGRRLVEAAARDPRPTVVTSGSLPRTPTGSGRIDVTNASATPDPGTKPGPIAGVNIVLDPNNIALTASRTGATSFFMGLKAFGHELVHGTTMLAAPTLQQAAAAATAQDAQTRPGSADTTGGTAETIAVGITNQLGPAANTYTPEQQTDAEADAIIEAGQAEAEQAAREQIEEALRNATRPH